MLIAMGVISTSKESAVLNGKLLISLRSEMPSSPPYKATLKPIVFENRLFGKTKKIISINANFFIKKIISENDKQSILLLGFP